MKPAKAQMDQVQRFAEKLRRWEDEHFYGEVTLRLKDGQIRTVEVKQTEVWDQAVGGVRECTVQGVGCLRSTPGVYQETLF